MRLRSYIRHLLGIGLVSVSMGVLAQSPQPNLMSAVQSHDLPGIQALLKNGTDVNAADVDGTTPLMLAVHERDVEMIRALLKAGANVDATNRYGATALHTAARNGDAKAALLLLDAGANPSSTSPEGETVLMAAAHTGSVEFVNALLTGGKAGSLAKADPNFKEGWMGQTALMWAAAGGHAEVVHSLIAGGALVDEFSAEISVPEVNPARRVGGFVYAHIPRGRMTALHFAARGGHLEAVRALIAAKANVNLVDADGSTAAILATLNGHPDIAIALLEAGADPKLADKYGRTLLFVATDMKTLDANPRPAPTVMGDTTYMDVIKLSLARGAEVDAKLKAALPNWTAQGGEHNPVLHKGATTLLRAAMSGDLEVIDLLLKAKADPLAMAEKEDIAPQGSAFRENLGATSVLQAAAGVGWRAEVSRGRDRDAIETIKLLLARGADINQANQAGDTPLHGAAVRGSPDIVAFLLQHGANPELRNARKLTALDIALGQADYRILPNEAVANVLRQHTLAKLSNNGR